MFKSFARLKHFSNFLPKILFPVLALSLPLWNRIWSSSTLPNTKKPQWCCIAGQTVLPLFCGEHQVAAMSIISPAAPQQLPSHHTPWPQQPACPAARACLWGSTSECSPQPPPYKSSVFLWPWNMSRKEDTLGTTNCKESLQNERDMNQFLAIALSPELLQLWGEEKWDQAYSSLFLCLIKCHVMEIGITKKQKAC